jgi:hypothetical protein
VSAADGSGGDARHDRPAGTRRSRKGILGAMLVTALLALYVWAVVGRGVALVRTGEPAGIAIGVAVLVLPLLVIGLVAREMWLAVTVQRMADELAGHGRLPVDDLPRSPGGRVDRAAADAAFGPYRAAVEAEPQSWEAWYHLAFAYDASGDRRRARGALRRAAALYRAPSR